MTDRISGSAFKQMVLFGAACITIEREAINDLNVFPVPDGDTGTNMSLTIQTAATELKKNQPVSVSDAPPSPPLLCCGVPGATPALSSRCSFGGCPSISRAWRRPTACGWPGL